MPITLICVEQRVDERADLLLVCSSGGHLLQLLALQAAWGSYSHVWVTFDKSDARSLLRDERVVFAHWPTNRSLAFVAIRRPLLRLGPLARYRTWIAGISRCRV